MNNITCQEFLVPYVLILSCVFVTIIVCVCLFASVCILRNGIKQKQMQDELDDRQAMLDKIESWLDDRYRKLDNT